MATEAQGLRGARGAWATAKRAARRGAARRADLAQAPEAAVRPLERDDLVWSAATGAIAAGLFSTVLEGHPALGDAPETVAGVASLGVLHPPGYPAYVLVAKAFTLLEPFGGLAFRVNLFSLVCASLAIAGVFLLARRLGADRWASALGALALAAGAGFWFSATFAKHNMFSGLVVLVTLHLLLRWRAQPTTGWLMAVGAALAVGLGSSWPLTVLVLPVVGYVVLPAWRQTSVRSLASATAVGLVLVAALYGFVMVRAEQRPAVNWGEASNVGALVSLVTRSDFTGKPGSDGRASRGTASDSAHGAGRSLPRRVGVYGVVFWRELGVVALILATWGLVASLRRPRRAAAYPLLIIFASNLLGAALVVGASRTSGYELNLIEEGFLMGCYFALASWLALGATDVVARLARVRWAAARPGRGRVIRLVAPSVLAVAVLVPSLVLHWPVANRASEPLADGYASGVFGELPHRSVVLVWGEERTQPLIYRQVVHDERRDVVVIAAIALRHDWYRGQVARRLGLSLPARTSGWVSEAARLVKRLRGTRTVFLDAVTAQALIGSVGYRPRGLLSEVTSGVGPKPPDSLAVVEIRLRAAQRIAGMPDAEWGVWPSTLVRNAYWVGALELARAYLRARDPEGLRRSLLNVLSINPQSEVARRDLELLDRNPSLSG